MLKTHQLPESLRPSPTFNDVSHIIHDHSPIEARIHTLILLADYTTHNISDLQQGYNVYGWSTEKINFMVKTKDYSLLAGFIHAINSRGDLIQYINYYTMVLAYIQEQIATLQKDALFLR